jgi:hypothetical protein
MNDESYRMPDYYEKQYRLITALKMVMELYEHNITKASVYSGVGYPTFSAIISGHRDAGQTSRKNVELLSKYIGFSVVDYYRCAGFLKEEDFQS